MKPKNCTGLEKWTEMEDLSCLTPSFGDGTVEYLKGFSALNILLSITAFLGNTLILVAMRRMFMFFYPWYSDASIFVDSPYWLHL